MGDDKRYTIQIKGTAYRFKPLPEEDITRIVLVSNMNASSTKTIKIVFKVLSEAAGPEQWDALTDRLIAKEISVNDIATDLFAKLVKRQSKDAGAADDAE